MNFIQVDKQFNPRLFDIAETIAQEFVPHQKQTLIAFCLGKGKRILSIGINSFDKTHSEQIKFANAMGSKFRIYLHAEISALVKCKGQAHSIFIVRFGKDMAVRSSKPCEICELAIESSGIKRVFYT